MATSGKAFAISIAIYSIAFFGILCLFSILRKWRVTRKFYAPRESLSKTETASTATRSSSRSSFRQEGLLPPPPPLGSSFLGWIPSVLRTKESQLLVYAGVDATLYLKILRLGLEIFALVSLIVLLTALPINLTSGYLDTLMPPSNSTTGSDTGITPSQVSPYTFWVPPPSAPSTTDASDNNNNDQNSNNKVDTINPPKIYNDSIPDPPPGITWWQYLPNIPLLPDITTALGPGYERYGWRYNQDYVIQKYYFTDLDKTTMANVPPKSSRLYAHSFLTWAVTALALWRIWSMCRTALRLRQYYLLTVHAGAETHSVLVTDIPGVPYGTIIDRLGGSILFKFIPKSIKSKAAAKVSALKRSPTQIMRKLPGIGRGVVDYDNNNGRKPVKAEALERVVDVEAYATTAAATTAGENSSPEIYSRATLTPSAASSTTPLPHEESSALVSQEEASKFASVDRWDEAVNYLNSGFTVPELVEEKFREIHGDDVAAVQVAHATSALDGLVGTYEKTKNQAISVIDTAVAQYKAGKKVKVVKKTVVGATLGQWGREKYGVKPVKIDAFEFYRYVYILVL
jgi:Late exocytosis, associated with Golgi transport